MCCGSRLLGRDTILLWLGKRKPWKGLAINRKKAKAMAGVMVFTPCSGHEAEAQRHQGLAEIAPHGCWHAAGVVLLA